MKKILLIAAGVIAAAVFSTSCVDNIESESVTAIRESKTAQLEALAEMYRTQAITDSIETAARIEYIKAETEYQNAMAELQRALAEQANANAEWIRYQMEQEAQKFELRLEYLRAEYQRQILELQKQIDDMNNDIIDAANDRLTALFESYKTELKNLNDMKSQLNDLNVQLLAADNNIIDAQEYVAERTQELEKLIAAAQAQIELYENYNGIDRGEVMDRLEQLGTELSVAQAELTSREAEMMQAYYDFSDYAAEFTGVLPNFDDGMLYLKIEENTHALAKMLDSLNSNAYGLMNTPEIVFSSMSLDVTKSVAELTYYDYPAFQIIAAYFMLVPYPEYDNAGYDAWQNAIDAYASQIENSESQIEATEAKLETMQEQLDALRDQLEAAEKAGDDALVASLNEQIEMQIFLMGTWEDYIVTHQEHLDNINAQIAIINRMKESYIEVFPEFLTSLSALFQGDYMLSYVMACIEVEAAYDKANEINSEYQTLFGIAYAGMYVDEDGDGYADYIEYVPNPDIIDVDEEIERLKEEIAGYEAQLEALTQVKDAEDAKADIENQIAVLTERIAIQEKLVESIKTALDAALAEE